MLQLEADVPAEMTRRQLGHSRIAITTGTYQRHKLESAERAAAQKTVDLIDSAE